MIKIPLILDESRCFDPDPTTRKIACELYESVRDLPIISPHGHVDPSILAEDRAFPDPVELLLKPNHYVFRMLYSQGIPLESIGIPTVDGTPVEKDNRKIWQLFADNWYLFAGTPSESWMNYELAKVFGVDERLSGDSAMRIYDQLCEKMKSPEFRPRKLYENFKIEVMATTDGALDSLEHHKKIAESGWAGRVIPTFRPDSLIQIDSQGWRDNLEALGVITGKDVTTYAMFLDALRERRQYFKKMGAVATDHAMFTPFTCKLNPNESERIFQKALKTPVDAQTALFFHGNMLLEMARMSIEDGLVMQIHPGCYRNHNECISKRFGADKGCDIPVSTEFTTNLKALLNECGNDINLRIIIFTMDESTYSRELAPLAGHYPALRLGPSWWFHDSINGMTRFKQMVLETAGVYNTVGFNDDTRSFTSIPSRHDLARRIDANCLAGLAARHIMDKNDAFKAIRALTRELPKTAYRL